MGREILEMTGYQLSQEIHSKKVSCEEVMDTYLGQIERYNEKVNAVVALQNPDDLMKQAKEKDSQLAQGNDNGWMHGFPQAVKDLAATAGIRTTMGSLIFKDWIPEHDAITVRRQKEAGSIIIGKTNVPEFGYGSQTYNEIYGATGNPYDADKTSGGSSGGAACAIAMRMLPVADGSDYMGSLRNPAGWCNVYGFRPSVGRVPTPMGDVFADYMGINGPMARNVADIALLLGTMSGPDPAAPLSREEDPRLKGLNPQNVHEKLRKDIRGLKIGWLGDWDGHLAMEEGILETTEKALSNLADAGVRVEKIKPFFDPQEYWEKVWLPLRHYSANNLKGFVDEGKKELLKPEAQWEYEGAVRMSGSDVYSAYVKRTQFYNAMMKVYEEYDLLAVPSAQVFPFDKTIHWPQEIAGRRMTTYHNWMEVVTHWTTGGNAIISAPAGFGGRDNLPIGIQFAAKPGCDFELLQFAKSYEEINRFAEEYKPTELK